MIGKVSVWMHAELQRQGYNYRAARASVWLLSCSVRAWQGSHWCVLAAELQRYEVRGQGGVCMAAELQR